MADILVRNVPDILEAQLTEQAERHGRSKEDEIIRILEHNFVLSTTTDAAKSEPTAEPTLALAFYEATRDIDGAGDDFQLPKRSGKPPRAVDFS